MGFLKVELSDRYNQPVYFHTTADIVYFNSRLTPGISGKTTESAIVQINQRINEMILLNESMERQIKTINERVETVEGVVGQKVQMFAVSTYVNKDKFEPTNGGVPYTQNIVIRGLKKTDEIVVGPIQSAEYKTAKKQLESYNCISRIIANDGYISMVCYEDIPSLHIPIRILVLRKEAPVSTPDQEPNGDGEQTPTEPPETPEETVTN